MDEFKTIDIKEADFEIRYENGIHVLYMDKNPLLTPGGHIVGHKNYDLIKHMMFELESFELLDVTVLSRYSLFSTMTDFGERFNNISKEEFRSYILSDMVLKSCAGPEVVYQYEKWGDLFENLELLNMKYPSFPQISDIEEIEKWIQYHDDNYINSLDNFVEHFYNEFKWLSIPQKTVVINALNVHDTIIYGILLATRKTSELDYTAAILAGICIIPRVFSDVTVSDYKPAFDGILKDANIMTSFIDSTLTLNQKTIKIVENNLSNWAFLPEGSRIALIEAINKIKDANSEDYSPYVVLLGKSVEIALKELVFDKFQLEYPVVFETSQDINIFIKENDKIERFATFLVKPPHFIELGSMLTVLQKAGGKTARNNIILSDFFEFIQNKLEMSGITDKFFIEDCFKLSKYRNQAAHSERFSLEETLDIQVMTFQLLNKM